jgi:hypothetical protein
MWLPPQKYIRNPSIVQQYADAKNKVIMWTVFNIISRKYPVHNNSQQSVKSRGSTSCVIHSMISRTKDMQVFSSSAPSQYPRLKRKELREILY